MFCKVALITFVPDTGVPETKVSVQVAPEPNHPSWGRPATTEFTLRGAALASKETVASSRVAWTVARTDPTSTSVVMFLTDNHPVCWVARCKLAKWDATLPLLINSSNRSGEMMFPGMASVASFTMDDVGPSATSLDGSVRCRLRDGSLRDISLRKTSIKKVRRCLSIEYCKAFPIPEADFLGCPLTCPQSHPWRPAVSACLHWPVDLQNAWIFGNWGSRSCTENFPVHA